MALFEYNLEENIFALHFRLKNLTYQHGPYQEFKISDPKPRIIHKAKICDRVAHQAVYRILYPIFDKSFIFDSYSSRKLKGTHRAVKRLKQFVRQISKNYKKLCFGLKLDVAHFFDSIDHKILFRLINKKVKDQKSLWLIKKIIDSFEKEKDKGLPLGNVTSQLFANIYLNSLDHFVKEKLRQKYYLRFCDDIFILAEPKILNNFYLKINNFLRKELHLRLKNVKIRIRKLDWGFDFLGYVILPHYCVLRLKTKKRMWRQIKKQKNNWQNKKISRKKFIQIINSYLGLIKHSNSYKTKLKIKKYVGKKGKSSAYLC